MSTILIILGTLFPLLHPMSLCAKIHNTILYSFFFFSLIPHDLELMNLFFIARVISVWFT